MTLEELCKTLSVEIVSYAGYSGNPATDSETVREAIHSAISTWLRNTDSETAQHGLSN